MSKKIFLIIVCILLIFSQRGSAQPRGGTHIERGRLPAGTDGQVQYNDDDIFGADAGFITDKAGTVTPSVALDTPKLENSAGQLIFNDTTTGTKTLAELAAGGAGGDNVTVNSTAVDTTANFKDGDIDFSLADGGAGGPDDVTGTVGCTGCVDDTDAANDLEIDNTTNLQTTGTVTGQVALDTPAISNSAGGDVTIRDGLTVGGTITSIGTGTFAGLTIPAFYQFTLLPSSAILDDNNPPALSIIESTGTGTPRFRVADFDASADEIIYWTLTVPSDMVAGNWEAVVYWYANDVGPNETCQWAIAVSATTEADADDMEEQAVDTANTATEDVNETEATRLMVTTITMSNLDSVAAEDNVTLRFYRDISGDDDLTSDARLVQVRLRIPRQ